MRSGCCRKDARLRAKGDVRPVALGKDDRQLSLLNTNTRQRRDRLQVAAKFSAREVGGNRQKAAQPISGVAFLEEVVPLKGLEPPTPSLRMTCSTS